MIWDYPEEYRDQFSKGVHRDILIVPHATKVEKVSGGPPKITYKVPKWEWVPKDDPNGHWQPVRENGEIVLEDIPWVITNEDIVKEKFKYSHAISSDDNLSFSACNAAMVQFTIRDTKEYNEDKGYWEPVIPNLQNYEFTEKDPDGTERKVTGELSGNACIKVYMYFNGDSDSLICLGMFNVDEDKVTGNGYERQITAYDFMAFFRDCDIFYWYKHLWSGINKLDDDFMDFTSKDDKQKTQPANYNDPENWVRKPSKDLFPDRNGRWTIGEALTDLINNFAAYDPITYDDEEVEEVDPETGKKTKVKKKVAKVGNTITNPNDYGRDYKEGAGYTGLGMPIMIDSDCFEDDQHNKKEYYIPEEPGPNEFECYGYMKIFEMEFCENPDIIKKESLSMGKFLEDIGRLAGRYPVIRRDRFDEHDFEDPTSIPETDEHKYDNRYNNYERCILTFKPLPTSQDDDKLANIPESNFSNNEIVKGFQHESYTVDDIELVKIKMDDKSELEYHRLTKTQRKLRKTGNVQTFTFSDNMFATYLVKESSSEDIKKKLDEYKTLREKLFGSQVNGKGNMSSKALFAPGYYNMKYRSYVPYQLTTYADPVRDIGDRIKINFTDKITGETTSFYTYILERSMEGIQKCMDTYSAKGDGDNAVFVNYKTSQTYQSGGNYSLSSFGYNPTYNGGGEGSVSVGISPSDLVQYWRNFGIRLLDEPTDCMAKFVKSSENSIDLSENHIYITSSYPDETYIKDGDTTNPITVNGQEIDIIEGDYVRVKNYQHDDPIAPDTLNDPDNTHGQPYYVYTANNIWMYVGIYDSINFHADLNGKNIYNASATAIHFLDSDNNFLEIDEITGKTSNTIVTRQFTEEGFDSYRIADLDTHYKMYGVRSSGTEYTTTTTSQAQIGDYAEVACIDEYEIISHTETIYQYPGFWVSILDYPKLEGIIEQNTQKYVSLTWTDPVDITDYKPTPATWEGTVIVRKENSAPLHRWDGVKVVRSTTRDKYKTNAYKDEDIEVNKIYYYGFFPYYTKISDPDHPIRFYTFTKYIRVETGVITYVPVIESITVDGRVATVKYSILVPEGSKYTSIKLYGKIGSNPSCDNTDDIIEDLDQTENSIDVGNLTYDSTYYFIIQCIDQDDAKISSASAKCTIAGLVPPEYVDKMNDIASINIGSDKVPFEYPVYSGNFIFTENHLPVGIVSHDLNDQLSNYTRTFNYLTEDQRLDIDEVNREYILSGTVYRKYALVYGRYSFNISYTTYNGSDWQGNGWHTGGLTNNYNPIVYNESFNTLADAINYVWNNIRGIILYVNGEQWAPIE